MSQVPPVSPLLEPFTLTQERPRAFDALAMTLGCVVILGLVETTSVYTSLQAGGSSRGWLRTLSVVMPGWLLMTLIAPSILRLARRFPLELRRWQVSAAVHLAASIVVAVGHVAVTSLTFIVIEDPTTWERFSRIFGRYSRSLLLFEIFAYWAVVGVYLTVHYSNLRTSLAEARLTALRTQLNPHFLFNALNAISGLALQEKHTAIAEMLGRLSELLRASLDPTSHEVPLSVEMDFVDHYVELQRIRFADRLQIGRTIDVDTLTGLVPSMLLQPIIENAIKHGVQTRRGAGRVDISARRAGDELVVEVQDTGPGFPVTAPPDGIGLANTKARLAHLYGSQHQIQFGRSPSGGASVRIVIPFRQAA